MTETALEHQRDSVRDNQLTIQFVGDISLNGLFCDPIYHQSLSRNLGELSQKLGSNDLRVGNWESPLWGHAGFNLLKQPNLCTTLDAAKTFLSFGLDVALLANNHTYDCLEKGFENTVEFFKDNGVYYLGAGLTEAEAKKALILTRKGLRLGLLNYVGPETNPNIPSDAGFYLNLADEKRLLKEVSELATQVDIVVLNLHWGTELVKYPSPQQRYLARHAVESGANIIVCHHSHCLQGHERWKEGHIFYSLGNFLFLKGGGGQKWSKFSRRTAVATCIVSRSKVERVSLRYLCQEGLTLKLDQTRSRVKKQKRLNRRLKLFDAKYRRVYKREILLQWGVFLPFRFILYSGGLIKALRRLRWQHIRAVFEILTGRS